MASGRKNYFRHSMTAFEDSKIQKAIELLGYEGYAFYFILIELLAKQCDANFHNPIKIHQQTLRIVWRKSQQSCNKVVTKLQQSGLFVVTFSESFYEFDIPNLAKYLGTYDGKFSPNAPNKRKENEIKVNEIKVNETKTKPKVLVAQKISPLAFLFPESDEVQKWLLTGKAEVQKSLLDNYSHHILAQEIRKAYLWQSVKSKRKSDLFLMNWLGNVKTNGFNPNRGEAGFSGATPTHCQPSTITDEEMAFARAEGII
jgi:hypothetical protein